jgi:hypothetical protein
MQEPTNRKNETDLGLVFKILGGIFAFFALLCVGFVFFVAVVCGK